jgi:hypothetical protein
MPRQKLDSVRVHLILPRKRYELIQKLSEKSGYSISELMRRALDEFMSKGKKNEHS